MRETWVLSMGQEDSPGEGNGKPLLAGESHRQRSLVGYSLQGHKQTQLSDFTSLTHWRENKDLETLSNLKTVPWIINYQIFKSFFCGCMLSEIICTIKLIFFITTFLCTPQDAKYDFKVWSFTENCWAIFYPMPTLVQGLKPSVMNPYMEVKSVIRTLLMVLSS